MRKISVTYHFMKPLQNLWKSLQYNLFNLEHFDQNIESFQPFCSEFVFKQASFPAIDVILPLRLFLKNAQQLMLLLLQFLFIAVYFCTKLQFGNIRNWTFCSRSYDLPGFGQSSREYLKRNLTEWMILWTDN